MWIFDDDALITNDQIPIALDALTFIYSPGLNYDCEKRERRPYINKANLEMTGSPNVAEIRFPLNWYKEKFFTC